MRDQQRIQRKSLNVEAHVVREMAIEKAFTGKDMYQLVRESWDLFKAARDGRPAPPIIEKHPHTAAALVSEEEASYVESLLRLMRDGNHDIREAVKSLLKTVSMSATPIRGKNTA